MHNQEEGEILDLVLVDILPVGAKAGILSDLDKALDA